LIELILIHWKKRKIWGSFSSCQSWI